MCSLLQEKKGFDYFRRVLLVEDTLPMEAPGLYLVPGLQLHVFVSGEGATEMQPLVHAHRGSLSVTAFFASAQLLTESEGGSSPLVHVLDLSPETEYASRKKRSLCFSCLCDGEGRADVLDHRWGHARRLRGPVLVREPFITSWEWVASLYQI